PLYLLAAGLGLLAFALVCVRLHTGWIALALSIVSIFALSDPSCYDHSFWILAAPLARARPVVALLLVALAAASQLVAIQVHAVDERFVALSLLYAVFGCVLLAVFARCSAARAASAAPSG
ncbi:MAG TPA: hypothetical protein VK509_07655, partial [Polyangiales bacterium]|nr:hypothetical protein [Polyangiales bacterium]